MQPKHILPLVLLIPLLLAACSPSQTGAGKTDKSTIKEVDDLFGDPGAGPNANIAGYAGAIKKAVEMKFLKAEAYKGKQCTIHIVLRRDGTLEKATAGSGGDTSLCNAALTAVKQAEIPPAPDEKTWQIFRNAPMDFKP
ncbi:TPA: cell envelope integrity protein TolA [Enterobacter roggenkampii]